MVTAGAVFTADFTAGLTAGVHDVPLALAAVRARWAALAEGMDGPAWSGRSRCELWTSHDVLRHVRDVCRLHAGGLAHDPSSALDQSFDNRETPLTWLEESTGEPPDATIADLGRMAAEEAVALARRVEALDDEVVTGPYGPIPWTLLTTHVVWDAWVHERDITACAERPAGMPSAPVEDAVVASYALFLASMVARSRQQAFQVTVALAGPDRHYLASVRPGHVEMSSTERAPDADLHGDLAPVVDSLAGRGPVLADVLDGDPAKREPLTWLRSVLAPRPA